MPLPLWVAAGSFLVALVGLLAALWPKGLRVLAAVGLVALALWPVSAAETPLAIGNGVVPDLAGVDPCDATVALEERGLRWSIEGGPVRSEAGDCEPADEEWGNPVVEHSPAPGTDLADQGVVRLESRCAAAEGCGLA